MTEAAMELERALGQLDAPLALLLERLVRDALALIRQARPSADYGKTDDCSRSRKPDAYARSACHGPGDSGPRPREADVPVNAGWDFRLTDAYGKVAKEIIACTGHAGGTSFPSPSRTAVFACQSASPNGLTRLGLNRQGRGFRGLPHALVSNNFSHGSPHHLPQVRSPGFRGRNGDHY
jgi:hypothetical protein